jgi:uncharacterized protein YebE (UPF0316 family)
MAIQEFVARHAEWLPVMIFFARVTDVSIGTVRTICVMRGQRTVAFFLGFFEVLIWVIAVSAILSHLSHWINLVAYAGGFATGNAVGMWIESKLALGTQTVSFVSQGEYHAVAERLRYADLSVTTMTGRGYKGPVSICMAVVPRRMAQDVIRMAKEIDPTVFVTVEDVRATTAAATQAYGAGKVRLDVGRTGRRWLK